MTAAMCALWTGGAGFTGGHPCDRPIGQGAHVWYTGADRGWPGDVPRLRYDIARLQALGWQRQGHLTAAVRLAVERVRANGF
jgi:nucleoside-diphosphate-sugar epimerase